MDRIYDYWPDPITARVAISAAIILKGMGMSPRLNHLIPSTRMNAPNTFQFLVKAGPDYEIFPCRMSKYGAAVVAETYGPGTYIFADPYLAAEYVAIRGSGGRLRWRRADDYVPMMPSRDPNGRARGKGHGHG